MGLDCARLCISHWFAYSGRCYLDCAQLKLQRQPEIKRNDVCLDLFNYDIEFELGEIFSWKDVIYYLNIN